MIVNPFGADPDLTRLTGGPMVTPWANNTNTFLIIKNSITVLYKRLHVSLHIWAEIDQIAYIFILWCNNCVKLDGGFNHPPQHAGQYLDLSSVYLAK